MEDNIRTQLEKLLKLYGYPLNWDGEDMVSLFYRFSKPSSNEDKEDEVKNLIETYFNLWKCEKNNLSVRSTLTHPLTSNEIKNGSYSFTIPSASIEYMREGVYERIIELDKECRCFYSSKICMKEDSEITESDDYFEHWDLENILDYCRHLDWYRNKGKAILGNLVVRLFYFNLHYFKGIQSESIFSKKGYFPSANISSFLYDLCVLIGIESLDTKNYIEKEYESSQGDIRREKYKKVKSWIEAYDKQVKRMNMGKNRMELVNRFLSNQGEVKNT
ncbi:MAG: hypothetical protein LIP09_11490 [Bacteroidales bacterium]|nr:hypothetical protein [Bacteroidales bacterium]